MNPEDHRLAHREKMRQRVRMMKAMCAKAIEACDSDAVVLIVSFADPTETSVRMSTFGNALLCKEMVEAAKRRMEREIEIDE